MVLNIKSAVYDDNWETITSLASTSDQAQYSCVYNKMNWNFKLSNLEIKMISGGKFPSIIVYISMVNCSISA